MAVDLCGKDNTVKVKYNGPVGRHIVPSPLRKFRNYGMHTRGDIFCVHFEDQENFPDTFIVLQPPPTLPPPTPPTEQPSPAAEQPEIAMEEGEEKPKAHRSKKSKEEGS